MTKEIKNRISRAISYRERIFYILSFSIVVLGMTYAGLVHSAVQNIITSEDIIKENRNQSGSIGIIEAKYFSLKNSVTLAVAENKGFKEPVSPTYISKKTLGVARRTSNEI